MTKGHKTTTRRNLDQFAPPMSSEELKVREARHDRDAIKRSLERDAAFLAHLRQKREGRPAPGIISPEEKSKVQANLRHRSSELQWARRQRTEYHNEIESRVGPEAERNGRAVGGTQIAAMKAWESAMWEYENALQRDEPAQRPDWDKVFHGALAWAEKTKVEEARHDAMEREHATARNKSRGVTRADLERNKID